MNYIEFDPTINAPKWISDLKLNQSVYVWDGVKTGFDDKNFIKFDPKIDNQKDDKPFCLSPISPFLMDKFTSCCIVKGKDHEYLYIMPSPMKVPSSQSKSVIINQMTGKVVFMTLKCLQNKKDLMQTIFLIHMKSSRF